MLPITEERYLKLSEVSAITCLSRATLLKKIARGEGPPYMRLGNRTIRFPGSMIGCAL